MVRYVMDCSLPFLSHLCTAVQQRPSANHSVLTTHDRSNTCEISNIHKPCQAIPLSVIVLSPLPISVIVYCFTSKLKTAQSNPPILFPKCGQSVRHRTYPFTFTLTDNLLPASSSSSLYHSSTQDHPRDCPALYQAKETSKQASKQFIFSRRKAQLRPALHFPSLLLFRPSSSGSFYLFCRVVYPLLLPISS